MIMTEEECRKRVEEVKNNPTELQRLVHKRLDELIWDARHCSNRYKPARRAMYYGRIKEAILIFREFFEVAFPEDYSFDNLKKRLDLEEHILRG